MPHWIYWPKKETTTTTTKQHTGVEKGSCCDYNHRRATVSPYHGSSAELVLVGVELGTVRFWVDVITHYTTPQLIKLIK